MQFFSTNRQSPVTGFREATIRGQAPDKGLYFPSVIPRFDREFVSRMEEKSNEEIAWQVMRPYVSEDIPDEQLFAIVSETINFPIPIVPVTEQAWALELFHGNTLAFKDVGARFMSRCLGYFTRNESRTVTVLVATSGDTGGAVADGFFGVEGVRVIILYPKGKVSLVQEKQLTTYGGNITAISVEGTFDDCQRLVKQAFANEELRNRLFLTSANSINVARWLPQQIFYLLAWKQWPYKDRPPVISVPSGNVGNICAGLLAAESGLPVKHFIAACNENDVISYYLATGQYLPKKAVPTISNAMDVGDPSNFVRILELFGHDLARLRSVLSAETVNDDETKRTISRLFSQHKYLPDPHGAVGFLALERYLQQHPGNRGIFLETAHPVKFYDVIEPVTGVPVPMPESVAGIMQKPEMALSMAADEQAFRDFLYSIK